MRDCMTDGIEINQNKTDFKMSIKKNRNLMVEQIKRLRAELKESVNEDRYVGVTDDEIRKSIEDRKKWAEKNGIQKDLIKKIEVVIKRALGISKINKIIGPNQSRFVGELNHYFDIGKWGATIEVTKQTRLWQGENDYYKAGIILPGKDNDYKEYRRKYRYKSEAELLKGIFNMLKKEKEDILSYG